jgi:hypothetical protein
MENAYQSHDVVIPSAARDLLQEPFAVHPYQLDRNTKRRHPERSEGSAFHAPEATAHSRRQPQEQRAFRQGTPLAAEANF